MWDRPGTSGPWRAAGASTSAARQGGHKPGRSKASHDNMDGAYVNTYVAPGRPPGLLQVQVILTTPANDAEIHYVLGTGVPQYKGMHRVGQSNQFKATLSLPCPRAPTDLCFCFIIDGVRQTAGGTQTRTDEHGQLQNYWTIEDFDTVIQCSGYDFVERMSIVESQFNIGKGRPSACTATACVAVYWALQGQELGTPSNLLEVLEEGSRAYDMAYDSLPEAAAQHMSVPEAAQGSGLPLQMRGFDQADSSDRFEKVAAMLSSPPLEPGKGGLRACTLTHQMQTVAILYNPGGVNLPVRLFDSHSTDYGDGLPTGATVISFHSLRQLCHFLTQRFPAVLDGGYVMSAYEINFLTLAASRPLHSSPAHSPTQPPSQQELMAGRVEQIKLGDALGRQVVAAASSQPARLRPLESHPLPPAPVPSCSSAPPDIFHRAASLVALPPSPTGSHCKQGEAVTGSAGQVDGRPLPGLGSMGQHCQLAPPLTADAGPPPAADSASHKLSILVVLCHRGNRYLLLCESPAGFEPLMADYSRSHGDPRRVAAQHVTECLQCVCVDVCDTPEQRLAPDRLLTAVVVKVDCSLPDNEQLLNPLPGMRAISLYGLYSQLRRYEAEGFRVWDGLWAIAVGAEMLSNPF